MDDGAVDSEENKTPAVNEQHSGAAHMFPYLQIGKELQVRFFTLSLLLLFPLAVFPYITNYFIPIPL